MKKDTNNQLVSERMAFNMLVPWEGSPATVRFTQVVLRLLKTVEAGIRESHKERSVQQAATRLMACGVCGLEEKGRALILAQPCEGSEEVEFTTKAEKFRVFRVRSKIFESGCKPEEWLRLVSTLTSRKNIRIMREVTQKQYTFSDLPSLTLPQRLLTAAEKQQLQTASSFEAGLIRSGVLGVSVSRKTVIVADVALELLKSRNFRKISETALMTKDGNFLCCFEVEAISNLPKLTDAEVIKISEHWEFSGDRKFSEGNKRISKRTKKQPFSKPEENGKINAEIFSNVRILGWAKAERQLLVHKLSDRVRSEISWSKISESSFTNASKQFVRCFQVDFSGNPEVQISEKFQNISRNGDGWVLGAPVEQLVDEVQHAGVQVAEPLDTDDMQVIPMEVTSKKKKKDSWFMRVFGGCFRCGA